LDLPHLKVLDFLVQRIEDSPNPNIIDVQVLCIFDTLNQKIKDFPVIGNKNVKRKETRS